MKLIDQTFDDPVVVRKYPTNPDVFIDGCIFKKGLTLISNHWLYYGRFLFVEQPAWITNCFFEECETAINIVGS